MNIKESNLQRIYNKCYKNMAEVYELIKDYFGEDNVDSDIMSFEQFKDRAEFKVFTEVDKNIPLNRYSSKEYRKLIKILNSDNSLTWEFPRHILIHFPVVVISNEKGKTHIIKDLYVRIEVSLEGTMPNKFTMCRTHYSYNEWVHNYVHSHVTRLDKSFIGEFKSPCLGSGPIMRTTETLYCHSDLDTWRLFCWELSKYVKVESLEGVPYNYIENLNSNRRTEDCSYRISGLTIVNNYNAFSTLQINDNINILSDFISYLNKHIKDIDIKFSFINGRFKIATPPTVFIINISNEFIKFLNSSKLNYITSIYNTLLKKEILNTRYLSNNKFYYKEYDSLEEDINQYNGRTVFNFNGKSFPLYIEPNKETVEDNNKVVVLNGPIINHIWNEITNKVNYYYGREDRINTQTDII